MTEEDKKLIMAAKIEEFEKKKIEAEEKKKIKLSKYYFKEKLKTFYY